MTKKGQKHSKQAIEKLTGRKLSKDHINNLKISHKGQHNSPKTEFKKGQKPWNVGKTNKDDKRIISGKKSHLWKGGITPQNQKIRTSTEYKLWREAVFKRDNWTCIWCGQKGGRLNADHIKPFALFPELRFAIDNGRTLCEDCHRKTNTYGGNSK